MILAAPDVETRVELDPPGPEWSIVWRGRVWHETDVTVEHLALIAAVNNSDGWGWLNVADLHPARGPIRVANLLVAFLAVEGGVSDAASLATIAAEVNRYSAKELLDAIRLD